MQPSYSQASGFSNQQSEFLPPQVISIDLSRKSKQQPQSQSTDSQLAKHSHKGSPNFFNDQDQSNWSQKNNPRVQQYSLPQGHHNQEPSPHNVLFFNPNGEAGYSAMQSQPTPTSQINIVNYKHKNYPAQSVQNSNRMVQDPQISSSQSQLSLYSNQQRQLRDVSGMNNLRDEDQELQGQNYDEDEDDEEEDDNNIDEMMSSTSASMIAQTQANRFLQQQSQTDRRQNNHQDNVSMSSNTKLINSSSITRKQPQNIKQINSSQVNPSSFQLQTQMLSPQSLSNMKQLRQPKNSSEMFNAFSGGNRLKENQTMAHISKGQWAAIDPSNISTDKTPNSMNKFEAGSRLLSGEASSTPHSQLVPKRLMEHSTYKNVDSASMHGLSQGRGGISRPYRQSDSDLEDNEGVDQGRKQLNQDEEFYTMTEQDAEAHQDAIEEYQGDNQDVLSQSEQDQDYQEEQEPEEEEEDDYKAFEQNNQRNGLSVDNYGDNEEEEEDEKGEIPESFKSLSPEDERPSMPIQIQAPNQFEYFSHSQIQSPDASEILKNLGSRQPSQISSQFPIRSSAGTENTNSIIEGSRPSDQQPFFNIQSYSGGVVERHDRFLVVKPGQQQRETTQSSILPQQHMIERNLQSHNNKIYRETVEDINSSEGDEESKQIVKKKKQAAQEMLDDYEQEQYQILSHSPIEDERYGKTQVMDHTSMIEESRIDYSQIKQVKNQIINQQNQKATNNQNKNIDNKHKQFFDDSSRNNQQPILQNRVSTVSASSTSEKFNRLQKQQRKDFEEENPLPMEQTQELKHLRQYSERESPAGFGEVNDSDFPQFHHNHHLHQQTSSSSNILELGTQEIVEPLKMADRRQSDSAVLIRNSIQQNERQRNSKVQQQQQLQDNQQNNSQKIQKQSYDYVQKSQAPLQNQKEEKNQVKLLSQENVNKRVMKEQQKTKCKDVDEQQRLLEEYKLLKMQMKEMQKIKNKGQTKDQIPKAKAGGLPPNQEKSQVLKSQDLSKQGVQLQRLEETKSRKMLQQQQSLKQQQQNKLQLDKNVLSSYHSEETQNEEEYSRPEKDIRNKRGSRDHGQQSAKSRDGMGKNFFKDNSNQMTTVQTGRRHEKLIQKHSPHRDNSTRGYKSYKPQSRDFQRSKSKRKHTNDSINDDLQQENKRRPGPAAHRDQSNSASPDPAAQARHKTNRTYISTKQPRRDHQAETKSTSKSHHQHQRKIDNYVKENQARRNFHSKERSDDDEEESFEQKVQIHRKNKHQLNDSQEEEEEEYNGHHSRRGNQEVDEYGEELSDYSRSNSNEEEYDSNHQHSDEDSYNQENQSYDSQEDSNESDYQNQNRKRKQKKARRRQESSEEEEEEEEYDEEEEEDDRETTKVIMRSVKHGNKNYKVKINVHEKKKQKNKDETIINQQQIIQQQQLLMQIAQYPQQIMLKQQLAYQQQISLAAQQAQLINAQNLQAQINQPRFQNQLDISSPTILPSHTQNNSFVPNSNNVSVMISQQKNNNNRQIQRDGSASHYTRGVRETSNTERYTGSFATSNYTQNQHPPNSIRRANDLISKHLSPKRDDLFSNYNQGGFKQSQQVAGLDMRGNQPMSNMYSPREDMSQEGSRSFIGMSKRQEDFYQDKSYQQQQQQASYLHQIKNRLRQNAEESEVYTGNQGLTSRNRQQMMQTNSSPVKYQNELNSQRINWPQNRQGQEAAHQRLGSRERVGEIWDDRRRGTYREYGNSNDRRPNDFYDKRSQGGMSNKQYQRDEDEDYPPVQSNKNRWEQQEQEFEERMGQMSRRQSDIYSRGDKQRHQDNSNSNNFEDDSLAYSKFTDKRGAQQQRGKNQRQAFSRERVADDDEDYEGNHQYRRDSFDSQSQQQPSLQKQKTGNFAELSKQKSSSTNITNPRIDKERQRQTKFPAQERSQERSRSANERDASFDEGVKVSNIRKANQLSPKVDLKLKLNAKQLNTIEQQEQIDPIESKKKAQMIVIGFDEEDTTKIGGDPFKNKPQLKPREKTQPIQNEKRSASTNEPVKGKTAQKQKAQKFEVALDDERDLSQSKAPKRVPYQRNKQQQQQDQGPSGREPIQVDISKAGGKSTKQTAEANEGGAKKFNNLVSSPGKKATKEVYKQGAELLEFNFSADPKKNQSKQLVIEDADPAHNKGLAIEIFDKKSKQAAAPQEKSLAEMFLAKKKEAQLKRDADLKQQSRDQDYHSNLRNQQEVSPDRPPTQQQMAGKKSEKTKEELAELRKQMMKNRVKSTRHNFTNNVMVDPDAVLDPAQEVALKKQKEKEGLMLRLAMGKKVQVDKKEMKKLTSKNFQNLPEIKKKKEEEKKRQELAERKAAAANYMKEFAEKRRMQLLKKQKSNVNIEE